MCSITESELNQIIDMTSDMVQDGLLPTPLSDKLYYLEYFVGGNECSEAMGQLLFRGLMDASDVLIEEKGLSLFHIITTNQDHYMTLSVYTHGSPCLAEYIIPLVNGHIHEDTTEVILKAIGKRFKKTLWL